MNPHLAELEKAHNRVFGSGGLLEQAQAALGGGTIATFFQNLLDQLGPIIGPIIINYLLGLLHLPGIPTTVPTVPGAAGS